MFDLPSAKRVRRTDLQSPPSSSPRSTPGPDLTALFRSRVPPTLTLALADPDPDFEAHEREPNDNATADDDEIELRLFAITSATPTTQLIRISSPEAEAREPGFLRKRPRSYYFAEERVGSRDVEMRDAAVEGADVVRMAGIPWVACAVPWKVVRVVQRRVGEKVEGESGGERTKGRVRKGKKSRIALRNRVRVGRERREKEAEVARERKVAEREKKTRRNREKKIKKKEKEKAKKAEGGMEQGGGEGVGEGS